MSNEFVQIPRLGRSIAGRIVLLAIVALAVLLPSRAAIAQNIKGEITVTVENGFARFVLQFGEEIETKARVANNILTLSGGNQQKTLFARALGSPTEIVLMDDPMRGVDVGTKLEVYDMIRAEAERGRSFVWYTTEIDELSHCDRAYIFRNGAIVAELGPHELNEDRVLNASFGESA